MTAPDPDEEPTRHGSDSSPPEPAASPSDRTLPAGSAARRTPPPPPPPAPERRTKTPSGAGNDPLVDKVLGGCRIGALLGRGAMGAVYKARQEKLDRDVAVKVIRPEMMTDARTLKRFEVEARTVGKFNSAHVVMVHDVGFELGVHYLVMEFVQGKNLRDHVKLLAGGRLPVGEALPLLRQAIKGLEEAQRLHVIHRDIKPDNLMITDRGVLKIADFGIAKPMQEDFSMTLTSELVGTPLYMSPEQCQGQAELDFRSDMYSLGATFYYLLTGEPPIRASSVYELIQTKTKLAHLCLWKALPGLDENNPLSRVIERMTALDREDRYESYEALLNDLVLVEHGQTVHVEKGGQKGGKGKPQPANRRAMWLLAALLLVVGGGAAAYVLQPPAVDVGKRVAEQLQSLRTRFAQEGPSDVLRSELGKVAPPKELQADHAKLRQEVEQASSLAAALRAIQAPKALAMPFDALRTHFEAVDKAVAANKVTGPEAVKWRERAVAGARSEAALSQLAITALLREWSSWLDARGRIAGDVAKLAAAEKGLGELETARTALLAIVPGLGEDAQLKELEENLAKARRELADTKVGTPVVDQSEPLNRFRAELVATGPTADLGARIDRLDVTRDVDLQTRAKLQNDFKTASLANEIAKGAGANKKPQDPQPPFKDVTDYWATLDRAFAEIKVDGKLTPWAETLRRELRAESELCAKVVAACGSAFTSWQASGRADAVEANRLREARSKAAELFPDAATRIAEAIPEVQLAAAMAVAAKAQLQQRWQADADKLDKRLQSFASLADWTAAAASVEEAFRALESGAADLKGDVDVAGAMRRLGETMQRWRAASERMQQIDAALAAAEVKKALPLATAGASGQEAKAEFQLAVDAIGAIEKAFDGLKKSLDVEVAATTLRTARETLRGRACLAATEKRLAGWGDALQRLQTAAAGMIPIPAGQPKGGAPVEAFFLSPTECSHAEFAQFVTELPAAVGNIADAQQALAAVAARFAGTGMTADRLRGLLDRSDKSDRLPIDNLTWYTAAACAAWQGRALPTADEWALAAFGDGGAQKFPWGSTWSNESNERNAGTSAVEVDAGGLSWRSQGARRLHHLAGNVAEWLASDAEKPEAQLAGGRFNDSSPRVSQERSAGALESAAKDDGRRGYGFRTVLRLRGFAGLDWPR